MTQLYSYYGNYKKTCLERYRSPEQYGDWKVDNEISVKDIVFADQGIASKLGSHELVISGTQFNNNDVAFLLYATWNSGDSFGYEYNAGVEFVWLFKNIDAALEIKTLLDTGYERDVPQHILLNNDKEPGLQNFRFNVPWYGYFERINHIEVLPVRVIAR